VEAEAVKAIFAAIERHSADDDPQQRKRKNAADEPGDRDDKSERKIDIRSTSQESPTIPCAVNRTRLFVAAIAGARPYVGAIAGTYPAKQDAAD
jgi:hypothetical protein